MSAREQLQALTEKLQSMGVQDVKFFFATDADTSVSRVTEDVVSALDAIVNSRYGESAPLYDSVAT